MSEIYTGKQIQIDLVNKLYRRCSRFLYFITLGDYWEKIPDLFIEISISKVRLQSPSAFGDLSSNTHTKCYTYRVYLRSSVKNVLVYDGDLRKAKKEAEKLSKYLDLKVIDYTNQEQQNN